MGLDERADHHRRVDENLQLSSRNLPHVNVVTVANADPVSLIRHDKVIVTRERGGQDRGDVRMSQAPAPKQQERLMQVLLAPVVSEKSTFVGEKHNQYVFRVASERDQARDQGRGRAHVQDAGEVGERRQRARQGEALRPLHGPAQQLEEGLRRACRPARKSTSPKGRPSNARQSQTDLSRAGASSSRSSRPGLHKGKPVASLVESESKNAGRNAHGRITMRHKGGGHKQHYRLVDFKRNKDGIAAKVERIEYDPNRSAHLALLLLRRRRAPLRHRAEGRRRRHAAHVRLGGADQGRQHAAAAEHPGRHARSAASR